MIEAVTMKGIVKVAGVSNTTVSRALNEHPVISTHTINHIKQPYQLFSKLAYKRHKTSQ